MWVFRNGSFGVLPLIIELEVSNYFSLVAFFLASVQGSLSCYFIILMVLFKTSSLLSNLYLNCSSILGLGTRNHILNICGNFLLCYISLAIYSQVLISLLLELVCYPNFSVVISFVLFDALQHVSSFGLLWQYLLLLVRCSCIIMSPSSGFFMLGGIIVNFIEIASLFAFIGPYCFQPPLKLGFDSLQGLTLLLKPRNCFIIANLLSLDVLLVVIPILIV